MLFQSNLTQCIFLVRISASKLNAGSMPFEALLNCKSRHTKGSTCAYSLFDEDMVKIGNVDDVSLEVRKLTTMQL